MIVTEPFINDLADMIKAVWPDVKGPIFRMTQMERRNWLDDIENGSLTAPYCVIEVPEKSKSDRGAVSANTWEMSPTVYFITEEKSGGGLVADLIESHLEALSDALLYPIGPLPPFPYTIYDVPTWTTSSNQPVNAAMLDKQLPYLSGSLTFTALLGYVR